MAPEAFYRELDPGIRFAVRVLHAAGFETCQSCEGGDGHAYPAPTIEMPGRAIDATGLAALATLADYALAVAEVSIVWNVATWLPYEKLWRIVFEEAHPERAENLPGFVQGYVARELLVGESRGQ